MWLSKNLNVLTFSPFHMPFLIIPTVILVREYKLICVVNIDSVPLLKLLAITYKIEEAKHSHLLKNFDYTFICQKYDLTREKKQYKGNILYVKGLTTGRNITCPFWHTHRPWDPMLLGTYWELTDLLGGFNRIWGKCSAYFF